MVFNSFAFAIFFPIVVILYFLSPFRYRWGLLLASSIFFYMWLIPKYILIIFLTIIVDYFAGMWIEKCVGRKRTLVLWLSIISTCLILFVFKYYDFAIGQINDLSGTHFDKLNLPLPIGLSFHTFQSLSYVIEVYRRKQKAEKNFGIYSLYVLFFPQLVAGPIERPQNLLWQFRQEKNFDLAQATEGIKLIAWGLFKKIAIADRLCVLVDTFYKQADDIPESALVIATIFFAFQIYADFSGYSDIARGTAKILGFELIENFRRPYFSKSLSEFWQRWHISLSTWFKDYLYISLGGNRVSFLKWQRNLLLTFSISGLWHGANWTYLVWGLSNGIFLSLENLSQRLLGPLAWLPKLIKLFFTFLLICSTWVFFRASSLSQAFLILSKIGASICDIGTLPKMILFLWENNMHFKLGAPVICFLIIIEGLLEAGVDLKTYFGRSPLVVRWTAYACLVMYTLSLGNFEGGSFIYFQF